MGALRDKVRINKTLISLKVVVFFVISGITALHVLHATKPRLLGLNFVEYRNISIIAPFVSILGPLIVGPLADRLAAKNANNFGRVLRFLTATCLLIAAIIFAFLFAIPEVQRNDSNQPRVSFACNDQGAIIYQQRCSHDSVCNVLDEKHGSLNLTHCTYSCLDPVHYEQLSAPLLLGAPTQAPSSEHSSEFDYEDDSTAAVTESMRSKRALNAELSAENAGIEQMSAEVLQRVTRQIKSSKSYIKPPHLCFTQKNENGVETVKNCHVYSSATSSIVVDTLMHGAINTENSTLNDGWCQYPLDGFQCEIPAEEIEILLARNGTSCRPMIQCSVHKPYETRSSLLSGRDCTIGDVDVTLGGYTIIRLLGDIFVLAALTLLNTAIVIAVRETSEGRGEVCRQYVWGAIGYVLLFSPLDLFFFQNEPNHDAATVALILVILFFIFGAITLLCSTQMPLSPPEWWWHTKTGMLVYPMSAIRRYSPEIILVTIVAILFGTFWSAIHSFLRWTFIDECAVTFAGIILVFVLFFNVDKFIEYCGHSNIFIGGFALFIIRFTALSGNEVQWLTIVMEAIEPTVIGIIWIAIILYMRHTMPRKLTATGQALAVLAFFGLGKGFGALIGLARNDLHPNEGQQEIHQWLAIVACIIALIYFIIYNLILAPRCAAKPQHIEELISGSASQNFSNGGGTNGTGSVGAPTGAGAGASLNGNGSGNYSPLRVYHNERGKKGQFRY